MFIGSGGNSIAFSATPLQPLGCKHGVFDTLHSIGLKKAVLPKGNYSAGIGIYADTTSNVSSACIVLTIVLMAGHHACDQDCQPCPNNVNQRHMLLKFPQQLSSQQFNLQRLYRLQDAMHAMPCKCISLVAVSSPVCLCNKICSMLKHPFAVQPLYIWKLFLVCKLKSGMMFLQ